MNYGVEISKKSLSNIEIAYSLITGNIAYSMYKNSKYELEEAQNINRMSRLAEANADTLRILLKGIEDKCMAVMNLITPLGNLLKHANKYIRILLDEYKINKEPYSFQELESITVYVDIAYLLESILVAPILNENGELSKEIDRIIDYGNEQYDKLSELTDKLK